jgi:hypothetical protein
MSQSRRASLVETIANLAAGSVISTTLGYFLYPLFGHQFSLAQNINLTAIFTVTSFARSYLFRRLFNYLTAIKAPQ